MLYEVITIVSDIALSVEFCHLFPGRFPVNDLHIAWPGFMEGTQPFPSCLALVNKVFSNHTMGLQSLAAKSPIRVDVLSLHRSLKIFDFFICKISPLPRFDISQSQGSDANP